MGASALMSALNALPWDEDSEGEGSSSDSGGEEMSVPPPAQSGRTVSRPKGELLQLLPSWDPREDTPSPALIS